MRLYTLAVLLSVSLASCNSTSDSEKSQEKLATELKSALNFDKSPSSRTTHSYPIDSPKLDTLNRTDSI